MQPPDAETPGGRTDGDEYQPPRIEVLGTLAELTQGGLSGPADGFGGAGDSGAG